MRIKSQLKNSCFEANLHKTSWTKPNGTSFIESGLKNYISLVPLQTFFDQDFVIVKNNNFLLKKVQNKIGIKFIKIIEKMIKIV